MVDTTDDDNRYLVLNSADLNADSLRGLIEEFVSRDGTDYGQLERTLDQKVDAVMRQLEVGEVCIVFDREEERANLILASEL
ncbi:MAG: YheU family protein [Myxococcales bacterium]|nr:YheU family protein [Myxococcales bacterium]